jgi:hypothetical protein
VPDQNDRGDSGLGIPPDLFQCGRDLRYCAEAARDLCQLLDEAPPTTPPTEVFRRLKRRLRAVSQRWKQLGLATHLPPGGYTAWGHKYPSAAHALASFAVDALKKAERRCQAVTEQWRDADHLYRMTVLRELEQTLMDELVEMDQARRLAAQTDEPEILAVGASNCITALRCAVSAAPDWSQESDSRTGVLDCRKDTLPDVRLVDIDQVLVDFDAELCAFAVARRLDGLPYGPQPGNGFAWGDKRCVFTPQLWRLAEYLFANVTRRTSVRVIDLLNELFRAGEHELLLHTPVYKQRLKALRTALYKLNKELRTADIGIRYGIAGDWLKLLNAPADYGDRSIYAAARPGKSSSVTQA